MKEFVWPFYGLLPAVLESDALTVVHAVYIKKAHAFDVGVVISNVLRLLDQVNIVSISFVPRLANSVVHGLAILALSHLGEFIWLDDCPLCVERLVLGDSSNSL